MTLQFTKRTDGGALLRCLRPDGSATWQRQDDKRAAFFPLHDLAHYAVETELGFGRGFYGLIADGWEIADTTGKGARGPLPDEAIEVEYIVGSLGVERSGDSTFSRSGERYRQATGWNSHFRACSRGPAGRAEAGRRRVGRVIARRYLHAFPHAPHRGAATGVTPSGRSSS